MTVSAVADHLLLDLRDAVRSLVRAKSYTAAAITTLALGIGATTAIFSVVSAVMLRPLPFPASDRLVQLFATPAERGEAIGFADLDAFRANASALETVAGYAVSARYLRGASGSERVMAVLAERSLFDVLGVRPLIGRGFVADDPVAVAVVSHRFWADRLGATFAAIGTTLQLDDESFTVIGVMPEDFQFPYSSATTLRGSASESRTDLWIPMYPLGQPPRGRAGGVVARMTHEATLEEAGRQLATIAAARDALVTDPAARGRGVRVQLLADVVVSTAVKRPLLFLLAAVAMVLALVCANVMNLSLVRMTLRSRDVAVRAALGARPGRLVRQFLTESLLLAGIGGAIGLGLARLGTDRLLVFAAPLLPRSNEVSFDWSIFLFLLAVSAATGIVFGIAPALTARRTDPQAVLKDAGTHGTPGSPYRHLRDALIVCEIALAFVLVIGGALLVRELLRLRGVETGLVSANTVTFHVGQRMTPRTDPQQFYDIANRVSGLPGVVAAGFTQMLPLQNWGWFSTSNDFRLTGQPAPSPQFQIELRYVTPGYFEAMGIAVLRGRGVSATDTRGSLPVIVVNETLARHYFGTADPIGSATTRGIIAGVVRDVRQVHLDRPANPEIYFPIAQNWSQVSELGMTLVVRTRERPEPLIGAVRSIIGDVNPNLAVFNIKTFDAVIAESLSGFTIYLWLMVGFAALAMVLAATGIYGVIAFVVAGRMREFAIRVAVGAEGARVSRLVVGHGTRLAALGIALGVLLTAMTRPLLQNLPVSVRPPDAALVVPVALFVVAVAVVACLIPARRASRIDLMRMLRND